jgi:cyanobactin maturation PatA/PatG family protease
MTPDIGAIPGLKQLWVETLGHPDICLAILDGPVDQTHSGLLSAQLTRIDTLFTKSGQQGPAAQHGTHVTSVIFGQHDGPVKGIAPLCRGLIVPIFSESDDGSIAPCSQIDLARAITQAVQVGAQIINISGGEFSFSGTAHPILTQVIQSCAEQGVLIIAAAGNEGCDCLHIPGALPSVLAVGAMDAQNRPLNSSNWGQAYRHQGILAPGEHILGALPGGGTRRESGTSYATAVVSGVVALLLSLERQLGQQPDPQAVRTALLESAHACDTQMASDCRPFLVGSLNIPGAYSAVTKGHREMKVNRQSKAGDSAGVYAQTGLPAVETGAKVGEMAPDFLVKDHTGRPVRLSDYRGKTVVLWFYPEADTPG